VCGAIAWILLIEVGTFLSTPHQQPANSDLLVVLGGGLGERAFTGFELFRAGYAPRILLTGIGDGIDSREYANPYFRVPYMRAQGVPDDAMILDRIVESTWDEARLIRDICERHRWGKVLVVSDPPHFRRLAWSLGMAMTNTGIEWRLIPARADWWNPAAWWENPRARQFVGMKVCKSAYYWVHYGLGIG